MRWWLCYASADGFHGVVLVDVDADDINVADARARAVTDITGQAYGFSFPATEAFDVLYALPIERVLTPDQVRDAGVEVARLHHAVLEFDIKEASRV